MRFLREPFTHRAENDRTRGRAVYARPAVVHVSSRKSICTAFSVKPWARCTVMAHPSKRGSFSQNASSVPDELYAEKRERPTTTSFPSKSHSTSVTVLALWSPALMNRFTTPREPGELSPSFRVRMKIAFSFRTTVRSTDDRNEVTAVSTKLSSLVKISSVAVKTTEGDSIWTSRSSLMSCVDVS